MALMYLGYIKYEGLRRHYNLKTFKLNSIE